MTTRFAGIYCGPAPAPADLLTHWNLDPALLLALGLAGWMFRRWPVGLAGVAILALVFVSPLCALSAALFSARVVHHVLLVAVAAPLLALALPRVRSGATLPFLVSTAALWGWHLPAAYDLALSDMAIYWLMQATLLFSALAFWRAVLRPAEGDGSGPLLLLAGYMQMALLGAILTFAPDQLYAIHAIAPMDWGYTPLADQQLGGLIMWVPAGLPYAVWGALLARRSWHRIGEASRDPVA